MPELIIALWLLFVAALPPNLIVMQQTVKSTPETPAYKLSGNNSLLTLSDGKQFNLNIDNALMELLNSLPKDIELNKLHDHVFMIKDHITDNLPDDASIPMYKSMNAQLNAYAHFFGSLFSAQGGSDE